MGLADKSGWRWNVLAQQFADKQKAALWVNARPNIHALVEVPTLLADMHLKLPSWQAVMMSGEQCGCWQIHDLGLLRRECLVGAQLCAKSKPAHQAARQEQPQDQHRMPA